MRMTEIDFIYPNNPQYDKMLDLAHKSKNLYNASLYDCKQHFFKHGKSKTWQTQRVEFVRDKNPDYISINSHIAGEILMQVGRANKASAMKIIKGGHGKVRFPRYKDKNGYNIVTIPKLAISNTVVNVGTNEKPVYKYTICPRGENISITSRHKEIVMIKFTVQQGFIKIYKIYEVELPEPVEDNGNYASIDIGINNIATLVTNIGTRPLLYNGRPIKSINQYYNKMKAKMQKDLPKGIYSSKKIRKLGFVRTNKINHELHNISKLIIKYCVEQNISKLIIGKNTNWKESINIGKVNNQKFVQIPHVRLINQLQYKARLVGIEVILTEESYTSKCSFFDQENTCKQKEYLGKRIKRGLFIDGQGSKWNADINAAFNIMRKVISDDVVYNNIQLIEDFAGNPIRITSNK